MSHVIKSNVSIFLSGQTAPSRCCCGPQMKGTTESTKLVREELNTGGLIASLVLYAVDIYSFFLWGMISVLGTFSNDNP